MRKISSDYTYPFSLDFTSAWNTYLGLREIWPSIPSPKGNSITVGGIEEIADQFDIFIMDGYGVLNIGSEAVPGMPDVIKRLQRANKKVFVLTNGASFRTGHSVNKFHALGYDFAQENIISSREVMVDYLFNNPSKVERWGVVGTTGCEAETLGPSEMICIQNEPELFQDCQGLILLASQYWEPAKNRVIAESLKNNPRPVLVANPDVCAPFRDLFSSEPGYYAHQIWSELGLKPVFFGKPFAVTYQYLFRRVREQIGDFTTDKVLMVGDTPQTDILGGTNAGLSTLLMTNHGLLKGQDYTTRLNECGIYPDYILPV